METAPNGKRNGRATRRDALSNRRKLLDAMDALQRSSPDSVAMSVVAEQAGLGVATAYRYFPSLDELRRAHIEGVIIELRDFSHECTLTGTALFDAVVTEWVHLVQAHGTSMVELRSREGVLTRLRSNTEPITIASREAWERPIRAVMRHLKVPDHHFGPALMLWNVIFDAREVLDLLDSGMTEHEMLKVLTGAYFGALTGWAKAAAPVDCR